MKNPPMGFTIAQEIAKAQGLVCKKHGFKGLSCKECEQEQDERLLEYTRAKLAGVGGRK